MSFGEELSKEFKKLVYGSQFNEIQLCTKLEDAFINLSFSHPTLVEIIHGSKSMVEFEYNANYINTITSPIKKECELGDMMFIVFSREQNQIRLMYMQNKLGKSKNCFNADFIQLDLLSRKPAILSPTLPKCVFGDKNILKNAVLSSVTSYGIFYKQGKEYDMSYLLATKVSPKNKGSSKRRSAQCNLFHWGEIMVLHGYAESQGEKTIQCFGDSLFNMMIGTPITNIDLKSKIEEFLYKHSVAFNNNLNSNYSTHSDQPTICIINADYNFY